MPPGAGSAAVEPLPARPALIVEDAQSAQPVDTARCRSLATAVLDELDLPGDTELAITFVDSSTMASLNREHMGHEGPTDVLSFPIDGADAPLEPDAEVAPPPMLGDIVICPEVAAANASSHAGSYDDEVALLVVHGLLHLLGMDHAEPDGRAAMQHRERELLAAHHGPLARDPWSD
jgi:probable rRNA maturation factor